MLMLLIACQTEDPPRVLVEVPAVAEEAREEPTSSAAPEASPAPAVTTRSDCLFVDENRTEDENGRVTVNCAGEILQAKAIYVPGGSFNFEIEAPAPVAAAPAPAAPPDDL